MTTTDHSAPALPAWEAAAKAKREAILDAIPTEWRIQGPIPAVGEQCDVTESKFIEQYLSPEEIELTALDAVAITTKIADGSLKATQVTKAFCHRAALAHQFISCLHEAFFDAAIADAEKLDAYYAEHGKTTGPLHGLPVSLKDQFHVKDVDTTMGYVGWIGNFQGKKDDARYLTYESELVRELRNLGAVLYCKTSVPHTLMTGETVNNIIGYTSNPKNRNLAAGGSSGGEGALIGFGGSPAGFGTDIGGSIRIPSAFNGLWGLRPSTGRLPYEGMANSMEGQNSILSVVGPLASSAGALRLLTKSVLSQQPWLHDPLVHEIPWRGQHEEQVRASTKSTDGGLCFGIFKHDGVVGLHPPVARALSIVVDAITKSGHKTLDWEPPSHVEGCAYAGDVFDYDQGLDVGRDFALSGEPVAEQVICKPTGKPEATATKIAATNVGIREWRKKYLDYWNSTINQTGTGRPVDAFIAPCAPFAAARPGRFRHYSYSIFVNVLDYSTVVIPVTTVDKSMDVVAKDFEPLSDLDRMVQEDYDPEIYNGAHVAVQLIGRRLQEEKVIALAEYIGELTSKKDAV